MSRGRRSNPELTYATALRRFFCDGFTSAYSGTYVERVQVSMADFTADPITFAEQQDEWLITKAITPKTGDYLTFQLCYTHASHCSMRRQ